LSEYYEAETYFIDLRCNPGRLASRIFNRLRLKLLDLAIVDIDPSFESVGFESHFFQPNSAVIAADSENNDLDRAQLYAERIGEEVVAVSDRSWERLLGVH
jgi:hypothetical protein